MKLMVRLHTVAMIACETDLATKRKWPLLFSSVSYVVAKVLFL